MSTAETRDSKRRREAGATDYRAVSPTCYNLMGEVLMEKMRMHERRLRHVYYRVERMVRGSERHPLLRRRPLGARFRISVTDPKANRSGIGPADTLLFRIALVANLCLIFRIYTPIDDALRKNINAHVFSHLTLADDSYRSPPSV